MFQDVCTSLIEELTTLIQLYAHHDYSDSIHHSENLSTKKRWLVVGIKAKDVRRKAVGISSNLIKKIANSLNNE